MIAVLGPPVNAEMGPTSEKLVKNAKLKDGRLNILNVKLQKFCKKKRVMQTYLRSGAAGEPSQGPLSIQLGAVRH
jgi:hypothetical protein